MGAVRTGCAWHKPASSLANLGSLRVAIVQARDAQLNSLMTDNSNNMRKKDQGLFLVAAGFLLMVFLDTKMGVTPKIQEQLPADDPESILARGEKLDLKTIDQYALELIPGVGPQLSQKLLEGRKLVKKSSGGLCPALTVIHGVGETTCVSLSKHLTLN